MKQILYIVPKGRKKVVLKKLSKEKKLYPIKFMTFDEIEKKLTFTYDERALHFLMKKYGFHYDVAQMYLTHLKEIKDLDFPNMTFLKEIKEQLEQEQLLIYDPYFKTYLKRVSIVCEGFPQFKKEEENLLEQLRTYTKVEVIQKEVPKKRIPIHSFHKKEDEIVFVANKICELLKQGISIHQIKLVHVPDDYESILKRIFAFYHIPLNFHSEISLYETEMGQFFLNHLENPYPLLLETFEQTEEHQKIYEKLIEIGNRYSFLTSLSDAKEELEMALKHTTISFTKQKNAIEVVPLEEIDQEYTFLLHFNQGSFPTIYKDEDYFSDEWKEKLGFSTSRLLNQVERKKTCFYLNQIPHLICSYLKKDGNQELYLSSLVEDLLYEEKKEELSFSSYSNLYNEHLLAKKYDQLLKYGIKDPLLQTLSSSYSIPYQSYQNQFTGISKEDFYPFTNNHITLSYSSLNHFFQCGFRYYMSDLLKLNNYEENFSAHIGTIFHAVLSQMDEKDFDLEQIFQQEVSKFTMTKKEQFFIQQLKKDLAFILETILEQKKHSSLKEAFYEHKVVINQKKALQITLKGFIDKILYDSTNKIAALIDYKTGEVNVNFHQVIHGLDLQLPLYLYFMKHGAFKDYEIAGFYLQKILNKEVNRDFKKTYLSQKKEALKLQGYSNSNESILETMDDTYENSEIIKGMKITSKGFGAYSKVMSTKQMDALVLLVEKKLEEAISMIEQADFSINPKKIGGKDQSCNFCEFRDVCFRKESDFISLKEYKDFEFLGGE